MQCNAPFEVSFTQTVPEFCVNVLNGSADPALGCRLPLADPTSNRVSHLACVPPDLATFQLGPDATFAFPTCLLDFLSATDCDCSYVIRRVDLIILCVEIPPLRIKDPCTKLNPDGFADPATLLFYVDNSFVRGYYNNNGM